MVWGGVLWMRDRSLRARSRRRPGRAAAVAVGRPHAADRLHQRVDARGAARGGSLQWSGRGRGLHVSTGLPGCVQNGAVHPPTSKPRLHEWTPRAGGPSCAPRLPTCAASSSAARSATWRRLQASSSRLQASSSSAASRASCRAVIARAGWLGGRAGGRAGGRCAGCAQPHAAGGATEGGPAGVVEQAPRRPPAPRAPPPWPPPRPSPAERCGWRCRPAACGPPPRRPAEGARG